MSDVIVYFRCFKDGKWENKSENIRVPYKKRCKGLYKKIKEYLFWYGYYTSLDTILEIQSINFKKSEVIK